MSKTSGSLRAGLITCPSRMGESRFTALDSWRGIAACMVALLHLRAYSHVEDLELVRNGYLFVDFFFVLSGFVIAASYRERLAGGFSLWRFMLLRFGRVYPLHLAVLLAFVAVDLLRGVWRNVGSPAMLSHFFMVNGLVGGPEVWNVPSWSVSTEFFTYLAFALAVVALRSRINGLLAAVILVFPVVIYVGVGSMFATGYEMIRCVYGFAAGAAAWHLFHRYPERIPGGTLAEAAAIAGVVFFVSAVGKGPWSIGAPIVFAAVVLIFALQRGAASRMLERKSFVFLGTVSYSIYMVHFFVAQRMLDAVVLARSLGIPAVDYIGRSRWAGDLAVLMYLLIVLAVSATTYRFVEAPARAWFRRLAVPAEPARAAA